MARNLPVHFSGDGYVFDRSIIKSPKKENYAPHIHESWELLFFLRGNVGYTIEGKNYKLQRGDLVLTKPSVFHCILPDESETYDRYNIVFDEGIIPSVIRKRLPRDVDIFGFGESSRISDIFEKIEDYSLNFEGEELDRIVKNLIEEIFYILAIPERYTTGQTVSNELVGKAIKYVHENLSEIREVDELCRVLYITKSHLHHLFNKHLGVSPKQYLISKKMLLAQKLIRKGEKLTAVYGKVGFDDYATFFRNYRKYFGYRPSEELKREPTREIKA